MVLQRNTDGTGARARAGVPHRVLADPSNRRTAPRISMEVSVSFSSDHNFYTGFTENISEGGLFVASDHIFALGTQFDLSFNLPELGGPALITAEVRWVREAAYADAENPAGMGVRFLDIAPPVAAAIGTFLLGRNPIFYPDDD